VSGRTLLHELAAFKGQQLIACADEIEALAKKHGFRVNAMDPETNNDVSIDNEPDRLDVWTDADSIITSFTIG
jgi:hypothetical protein